jgi:hypothetical protein
MMSHHLPPPPPPPQVVATRDSMYKKMESVIQQLLARGARLYILCNIGDETMKEYEQKGCKLIQVCACVRLSGWNNSASRQASGASSTSSIAPR